MGLVTFMGKPHKWQEINWLEMSPVCIIQSKIFMELLFSAY